LTREVAAATAPVIATHPHQPRWKADAGNSDEVEVIA
jgi:hypothetical protein